MSTDSKVKEVLFKEFMRQFEMAIKDYPLVVLAMLTTGTKSPIILADKEINPILDPKYVRRHFLGSLDQDTITEAKLHSKHCMDQLRNDIAYMGNTAEGMETVYENFTKCLGHHREQHR